MRRAKEQGGQKSEHEASEQQSAGALERLVERGIGFVDRQLGKY
jgi:hypothetical protein